MSLTTGDVGSLTGISTSVPHELPLMHGGVWNNNRLGVLHCIALHGMRFNAVLSGLVL